MSKCKLNPDGTTICSIQGIIRPYSYDTNQRYYSTCEKMFPNQRICPCCGSPLRGKPRGRKAKDDWNKRNNNNPYLH